MLFPDLFRDDVFLLETSRLWLRWPRATDAANLQRFASLAEVAEMTASWPHPLPPMEADRRILKARQSNAGGQSLVLALTRKKEPSRLIGIAGLHAEGGAELGLGFMLDPAFHSRGFVTEAVAGMIDAVFMFSPFRLIRGDCRVDNPASRRVFEKCGFTLHGDSIVDAPARRRPLPCHAFALERSDWQGVQAALPRDQTGREAA
ncbi:MAG: GNAT family N-acetyltransferase [Hyphomicrobiaceae bacterium]